MNFRRKKTFLRAQKCCLFLIVHFILKPFLNFLSFVQNERLDKGSNHDRQSINQSSIERIGNKRLFFVQTFSYLDIVFTNIVICNLSITNNPKAKSINITVSPLTGNSLQLCETSIMQPKSNNFYDKSQVASMCVKWKTSQSIEFEPSTCEPSSKGERIAVQLVSGLTGLDQCDHIWRFIGLKATFQRLWQQLICPNLPHSWPIFVKLSKSIIFLMKSFLGNFYRQWSHWTGLKSYRTYE